MNTFITAKPVNITTNQPQGSVLVATLVSATIVGIALASYLVLVGNQNLAVARSFVWNSAMPVLESGEETLVGGQAVIEGVMMRAPHSYCVAVRKPNGEIVTRLARRVNAYGSPT